MKHFLYMCVFAILSPYFSAAQSATAFKPPYYIKFDPIAALFHGNQSIGFSFEKPYRDVSTWELDLNYVFNVQSLGRNNGTEQISLAPGRTSYKIALAKKFFFKGAITGFRYNWYQGGRVSYSNISHEHVINCNNGFQQPGASASANLPTDVIRKSRTTFSYLFGYQKIKDRFIFDVYMANGITFVDYKAQNGTDLTSCRNNFGGSFFFGSSDSEMLIYREGNDFKTEGTRVTFAPEFGLKIGVLID